MAQMQLFIVFPEYVEKGNIATAPYIKTIDILDSNVTQEYINKFERIISFFSYEDYDGYYDTKNLEAFSKPLEIVDDCYPGQKTALRNTIKKWGNNWRNEAIGDNGQNYYFYSILLIDDTLTEIARRKRQIKDTAFLVVNNEGLDHKENFCLFIIIIEQTKKYNNVTVIANHYINGLRKADCLKELSISIRNTEKTEKEIIKMHPLYAVLAMKLKRYFIKLSEVQ
jgi:hypothetical protein